VQISSNEGIEGGWTIYILRENQNDKLIVGFHPPLGWKMPSVGQSFENADTINRQELIEMLKN